MTETKTETVTLRIRPSIKALAVRRAKQEDRSLANYIEQLILRDAETSKGEAKARR